MAGVDLLPRSKRALGRDVVLLEKNSQLGGSAAWSIGLVTVSGTPYQARKSIADTIEDHWRDMAGFNGDLDGRDQACEQFACHQDVEHTCAADAPEVVVLGNDNLAKYRLQIFTLYL